MQGADASAGTIKSGGATRRAAKMVVLDVDHPDIEEFIDTKVREEEKIRVLRDAGFDMDLGARTSRPCSTRTPTTRCGCPTSSCGRSSPTASSDQGPHRWVRGRDRRRPGKLFRRMAEAAWACADPGIQYDDTINDWHTNPRVGGSPPPTRAVSTCRSTTRRATWRRST